MKRTNKKVIPTETQLDDGIDDILNEIEMQASEPAEIEAQPEPTPAEEPKVEAQADVDVEVDEILQAIDQVDASTDQDIDASVDQPEKPKTRKKAEKSAEPPAPSIEFASIVGEDTQKEIFERLDKSAKKVIEKAKNVIAAVERGKKLSGFTKDAVIVLASKPEIQTKDLVEHYVGRGLSIGTARAQAQQMTSIFKVFGIAEQNGSVYRKVDSPLAAKLEQMAA